MYDLNHAFVLDFLLFLVLLCLDLSLSEQLIHLILIAYSNVWK